METRSLFRKFFAQTFALLIVALSASFSALAQDNSPNAEPSASPSPANPEPQATGPVNQGTGPANQGTGSGKQGHANPVKMKQRQLARLQKILQLTSDQQTKITPVISEFVDQMVAVRNDGSLQPQEKKARQKALRKQYNQQLRTFLTPQQKQALRNARGGQNQGKGQNQNQNPNSNQEEDEKFEQGSNQPGSDI
jgi:hypothetical protein